MGPSDPGKLIHKRRLEMRLSLDDVVALAGGKISRAGINKIERGISSPTWRTVEKLFLAMGQVPRLEFDDREGWP